ncbi:MAG: hypothetical protein KBC94_23370 [Pseudacidovorax sp.]|uniref:hypothetical protein n=1 Tax=Pseudacidovorax sp. TaxID=1934311 RepID=UPI001B752C4B|nr:hypothetical protein [Pseudacidovorax sp.]MBP6897368.1 hypothetical protein [Pseudacidovorax sp.]
MSLATRALRLRLLSAAGNPLGGAKVSLHLSAYQVDGTDIVPLQWDATEDPAATGDYILVVWPNTRGDGGTHYDMLVQANGQVLLRETVTVPAGDVEALVTAKINPAPWPQLYEAAAEVQASRWFSDAAGESASLALAAKDVVLPVAEQFGNVAAIVGDVTAKRDQAGVSAAASTTQAGIATVQASIASAASGAALAAGRIVATRADGLVAYPSTALPDSVWWVLPNATDGYTALTCLRRTGPTTTVTVQTLPRAEDITAERTFANRVGLHNATVALTGAGADVNDWTFTYPNGDTVINGDWVRFRAPATNTGLVLARMPEGIATNFFDAAMQKIGEKNPLIQGRWYVMERIVNGGGNHYRCFFDDALWMDARAGKPRVATATVAAGTSDMEATVLDDPYTLSYKRGAIFVVRIAQATTAGQALRLRLNGSGQYPVVLNSTQVTEVIPANTDLTVMWADGPGNNYLLLSWAQSRLEGKPLFADGSVAAGTADVDISIPEAPGLQALKRNQQFTIRLGNVGTAEGQSLRVRVNGYAWIGVAAAGGGAYTSALPAFSNLTVMYTGAPGNNFLLTSVQRPATGVVGEPLDAIVAAIQAMVTTTPYGAQTYSNGVVTQTDNQIPLVSVGTSVGLGAGSYHPSSVVRDDNYAPVKRMAEIFAEEFGLVGNFAFPFENQSVGGSFDNQAPAQFAARSAAFQSGRILLLTPGMNAASAFGQFTAATRPGQINGLRTVCQQAISAGFLPVLQTTMHPHPLLTWQGAGTDALDGWNWPTPTFRVQLIYTVDAAAMTITNGAAFQTPQWGSGKIKVGSILRFTDGPNAGVDHVITALNNTTATIGGGTLLASEAATRTMYHRVSVAENETLLPVPPSKRYVRANRSGSGLLMGVRLWDAYNAAIAALARELRVPLVQIDKMSFDFVSANGGDSLAWDEGTRTMTGAAPGWDAGYTTSYPGYSDVKQNNHPNVAHRAATFDLGARKLARLITSGQLSRDAVIR